MSKPIGMRPLSAVAVVAIFAFALCGCAPSSSPLNLGGQQAVNASPHSGEATPPSVDQAQSPNSATSGQLNGVKDSQSSNVDCVRMASLVAKFWTINTNGVTQEDLQTLKSAQTSLQRDLPEDLKADAEILSTEISQFLAGKSTWNDDSFMAAFKPFQDWLYSHCNYQ